VNRMKRLPLAFLLAATLGVTACSPRQPVDAQAATGIPTASAFQEEHADWVRRRAADLGKPDGWTSLTGLHWLEAGTQRVGGSEDNDIRLAIAPARLGQIEQRGDAVFFQPADGVAVTTEGTPVLGSTRLTPEGSGGGTTLSYDDGKGKISVIRRGQRLALRVRHADAPARVAFSGLDFFPADEGWRLQARFVPHPAGRTLPIASVIGEVTDTPNPGYVVFEKEGRQWRLEALGDPAKGLNLMFQDQTTGRQTYGVGRYLRTDVVAADGSVALDFNRAYNPPCAYTEFATCPLPPPENRLAQQDADHTLVRLAVLSGERKYSASHD